ncbi:hypothetical protein GGI42DRAFT_342754 [Trichoderma sp. SZMC 28013]
MIVCSQCTWHDDTYPAIDPTRPELTLFGRTAVITGGGSDIGGAIAQSFAKAGISHNKTRIAAINPQTEVLLIQADIVNGDQVQKAFETVKSTFGEPHILVNNAAYFDGPVSAFEINVKGSLHVIRSYLSVAAALPRILNVSSGQAHLDAKFFPGMSAYLSSKMAQLRMIDAIQAERPDVFVINCHPGRVMNTLELSGDFGVWAVSDEAEFLKGRMVWVTWDVDELKVRKDEIINNDLLTAGLGDWPFKQ